MFFYANVFQKSRCCALQNIMSYKINTFRSVLAKALYRKHMKIVMTQVEKPVTKQVKQVL